MRNDNVPEQIAAIREKFALIRNQFAEMANEIERLIAFDEAVALAYQERTGEELQPGEPYTAKDAERAEEILNLYPWNGT